MKAPERTRTRCAGCHRRRMCWVIRRVGLVLHLCDDCLFDWNHGLDGLDALETLS